MVPAIRPMTPADVDLAADLLERGEWGPRAARHSFFAFAVRTSTCRAIVAELDGAVVGTGVGTVNGRVGWVGTIFVDRGQRGRGLGQRLTEAVIADLDARGCETLVLVATDLGRPLYERLGFTEQGWYQTYEVAGLPAADPLPSSGRIDRLVAADLPAMIALDRIATGEDRAALLEGVLRAAEPDPGWALHADPARPGARVGDGLDAFLLRPPWGGGATIARTPEAARTLLDHRRRQAGPERRVRAGLLRSNEDGAARLIAAGWRPGWRAVRMARGAPLDWHPEMIWGQLNFALG